LKDETMVRIAWSAGHYVMVGVRGTLTNKKKAQELGWEWARGIGVPGAFFTRKKSVAESTAKKLGIVLE
jgi:hypothetical protein